MAGHRFYDELAAWWPLISPPAEYEDDAAQVAALLESAARPVRDVLELGSGGGHLASWLAGRYELTLVDLSEEMLAVSRRLNPTADHAVGDMRTVRLGRDFDAVYVHDAIDYMVSEEDLRAAVRTAWEHCRPDGVAVFMPDHVAETFAPATHWSGEDGPDGRGVRLLEWSWDPDPHDRWIRTDYVFVLRDADGSVRVEHEPHRTGLFSSDAWFDALRSAGFAPSAVAEEIGDEDRVPRTLFVGRR